MSEVICSLAESLICVEHVSYNTKSQFVNNINQTAMISKTAFR
jgi:hypothetical protein